MSQVLPTTARGPLPATPRPQAAEPPEELRRAAEEFEGLFLRTLLRSMRSTVPESALFGGEGEIKYYREMHDEELARSMATSGGGLGVADMIVRQLTSRGSDPQDSPVPVAVSPTVGEAGPPRIAAGPAPETPASLRRYRAESANGRGFARLRLLREQATRQGEAVADTLRRIEPDLTRAANRTGLDPALLLAVVMRESGGDPQARSPKGAMGLMQLMPATARELGVEQPYRPDQNLMGGASYLARLQDRFGQRLDLALAAYNAGPSRVEAAGHEVPAIPETQHYVKKVMALYDRLRGTGGTEMASP